MKRSQKAHKIGLFYKNKKKIKDFYLKRNNDILVLSFLIEINMIIIVSTKTLNGIKPIYLSYC